ncbi:MAG: flagellar hook assembly protein FlgD [Gammaproteobacteria bacterium]|nr:flagellar hook assembly protein FlgD [Gammaproteobacteria bacterium]
MANNIDSNALSQLGLAAKPSDKPRDRLGQEDFMRLMITQLRNQDPFAPMESGEFLGQLAQFGTVSGIEDMRKSFESLAGTIAGNQTLQAAGLVDRQVLVPAREGWLPPEGSLAGAVDIPQGVNGVTLGVYDLSGRLVTSLPVDSAAGGQVPFRWDGQLSNGGRADPGFYELRATGTQAGSAVALDALVSGRVESVALGGRQGSLSLTVTGLGVVDFSRVRGIAN